MNASSAVSRRNLILLWGITFLENMSFIAPVNTVFRMERGVTLAQIGMLTSLQTAGVLICIVPWGVAAGRLGYRRTLGICYVLNVIAEVFFCWGKDVSVFAASSLLTGIAQAGTVVCLAAYVFVSAPVEKRAQALGINTACTGLGMMVSAICYSTWLGGNMELSALLTVGTQACVLLLVLGLKDFRPQTEDSLGKRLRQTARLVRKKRGVLVAMLPLAMLEAVAATVTMVLNQAYYREAGIPDRYFGWFLALVRGLLLLAVFVPRLLRLGERKLAVLFGVVGTVSCAVLGALPGAVLTVSAVVCLRVTYGVFRPVRVNLQNRLIPDGERTAMLAVLSLPFHIAAVLSYALFGALSEYGLALAGNCAALAMLLLALLCAFVRWPGSVFDPPTD